MLRNRPPAEVVEGLGLPLVAVSSGGDNQEGSAGETASGATGLTSSAAFGSLASGSTLVSPAQTEDSPFLLGNGLVPVLVHLVTKILRGEYVDMAELLSDNLEAQRRGWLQDPSIAGSGQTTRRQRREIPHILSWVQCFSTFVTYEQIPREDETAASLPDLVSAGGPPMRGSCV